MMKRFLALVMVFALTASAFAASTLYRGNSTDEKDAICYSKLNWFYADAAYKQKIYNVFGNTVSKGTEKASEENAIYRLQDKSIYKGFSIQKEDCLATILETKIKKGVIEEALIFEGLVTFKDKEETRENNTTTVTKYSVVKDEVEVPGKILYTIKDNKVYRGSSTKEEDCLLTFTSSFSAARLLFLALEFAK